MNLYLLEDNPTQQLRIKRLVSNCQVFSHPTQFLAAVRGDSKPKIILLDLEIKSIIHAGLNVAKCIRKFDVSSTIIIITSHTELTAISYQYQIGALDFIDKLQDEKMFEKRLLSAIDTAKKRRHSYIAADKIMISNSRMTESIDSSELVYVEMDTERSHRVILSCEGRILNIRGTLKSIVQSHDDFMQVHASYAIHRQKITHIDYQSKIVTLNDKQKVPFSKKYAKTLRQICHDELN